MGHRPGAACGVHLTVNDQFFLKYAPVAQRILVIVKTGIHFQPLGVVKGVDASQIGDPRPAFPDKLFQHLADGQLIIGHDAVIAQLIRGGIQEYDVVRIRVKIVNLLRGKPADGHQAVNGLLVVLDKMPVLIPEKSDRRPLLLKTDLVQDVFQHEIINIFHLLLHLEHLGNTDPPLCRFFGLWLPRLHFWYGLRLSAAFSLSITLPHRLIAHLPGGRKNVGFCLLRHVQRRVLVQYSGHGCLGHPRPSSNVF